MQNHILDPKILASLRAFARSSQFLPHLILTFENHGKKSLEELARAFASSDFTAMASVAHRFKGSCLNIGAVALAAELKSVEELSSSGPQGEALEQQLESIKQLFDISCEKLKSFAHDDKHLSPTI